MTLRERVIVETYTGICMVTGDERAEVEKYMEELMGRPVYTHELANKEIWEQLKKKALPDFKGLCISEGKWNEAREKVWKVLTLYLEKGTICGYIKKLTDLMERYNNGERKVELYEAMIEAKYGGDCL